jgi:hypothetical protein
MEVIKEIPWITKNGNFKTRRFLLRCHCGNKTECNINILWKTKSCWCAKRNIKHKPKRIIEEQWLREVNIQYHTLIWWILIWISIWIYLWMLVISYYK